MTITFEKSIDDKRGKIFRYKDNEKHIILVETKAGFARGGHFHQESDIVYTIISGLGEYLEYDVKTNQETKIIYKSQDNITIKPNKAHLLIAKEDTIFLAVEEHLEGVTVFPKYRDIVDKQLDALN
jgi:quercetin dioxygenase-like cupin family protein